MTVARIKSNARASEIILQNIVKSRIRGALAKPVYLCARGSKFGRSPCSRPARALTSGRSRPARARAARVALTRALRARPPEVDEKAYLAYLLAYLAALQPRARRSVRKHLVR